MTHAHARLAAAAFSLIEVLIAVLVLAFGLLGLAAVFPVVISRQRDAQDLLLGEVAAEAARDAVEGYAPLWRRLTDLRSPFEVENNDATQFGVRLGVGLPADVTDGYDNANGYSYLWEADWTWGRDDDPIGQESGGTQISRFLREYRRDGGIRFGDQLLLSGGQTSDLPDIPVEARLIPEAFSIPQDGVRPIFQDGPQYIWDVVARRASPEGDVQAAVFVRRIDTGIRRVQGATLSEQIVTGQVLPVGYDPATNTATQDGRGEYAVPLTARATSAVGVADPATRQDPGSGFRVPLDIIQVTVSDAALGLQETERNDVYIARPEDLRSLAVIGQRFVDNLGVVRTVLEVVDGYSGDGDPMDDEVETALTADAGAVLLLRVEPAYTPEQLRYEFSLENAETPAEERAAMLGSLRQILFTPREPAGIFVVTRSPEEVGQIQ